MEVNANINPTKMLPFSKRSNDNKGMDVIFFKYTCN